MTRHHYVSVCNGHELISGWKDGFCVPPGDARLTSPGSIKFTGVEEFRVNAPFSPFFPFHTIVLFGLVFLRVLSSLLHPSSCSGARAVRNNHLVSAVGRESVDGGRRVDEAPVCGEQALTGIRGSSGAARGQLGGDPENLAFCIRHNFHVNASCCPVRSVCLVRDCSNFKSKIMPRLVMSQCVHFSSHELHLIISDERIKKKHVFLHN